MKKPSLSRELLRLEDVQTRLISLCSMLENDPLYKGKYDDYYRKLSCVVGSIEDVLSL